MVGLNKERKVRFEMIVGGRRDKGQEVHISNISKIICNKLK